MQLTLVSLLAATALAVPAPASNTASCAIEYSNFYGTWTVLVGRPYLNGEGCDFVKDTIHEHMTISDHPGYKCEDDGSGNTKLRWSTNGKTKKVNQALQEAYPMIPFVEKNICDPYLP